MYISALFTVAKIWTQPKCPLIDEWIQKTWCRQAMEYDSAIKKNEVLPLVTTWVDVEDTMLRDIC